MREITNMPPVARGAHCAPRPRCARGRGRGRPKRSASAKAGRERRWSRSSSTFSPPRWPIHIVSGRQKIRSSMTAFSVASGAFGAVAVGVVHATARGVRRRARAETRTRSRRAWSVARVDPDARIVVSGWTAGQTWRPPAFACSIPSSRLSVPASPLTHGRPCDYQPGAAREYPSPADLTETSRRLIHRRRRCGFNSVPTT